MRATLAASAAGRNITSAPRTKRLEASGNPSLRDCAAWILLDSGHTVRHRGRTCRARDLRRKEARRSSQGPGQTLGEYGETMTESDESKNVVTDSPDAATREKPEVRKKRRRWVVILRYVAVSALALVLLSSIGIGAGEYYTSQPNFCGSCHNMEPYYDSWSHDIHGAKLGVKCVDCHYAPGEKFTFKAKFKGLSQAASYFSGRSGTSRPRAHVSDASCTTSRCHGAEAYLTKPLLLGERRVEMRRFGDRDIEITRSPTVQFSHDVHIGANDRLAETELRLKELSAELESAMPADEFGRLREVAISVGPPDRREAELRQILVESRNEDVSESALELMRLEHARTRRRLTRVSNGNRPPRGPRLVSAQQRNTRFRHGAINTCVKRAPGAHGKVRDCETHRYSAYCSGKGEPDSSEITPVGHASRSPQRAATGMPTSPPSR